MPESYSHATPDLWGPGGAFHQHIPGYEPRPNQETMCRAVARAFDRSENLIVEAGTGTGKGLAYLAPAILAATRNPEVRVAVSTATINLQEQLIRKDVPQTISALEASGAIQPNTLRWTALKGRANYLCHHQHQAAVDQGVDEDGLLDIVSRWRTSTGDVAELSLNARQRGRWNSISSQYASSCPFYKSGDPSCHLLKARNRARDAHIVIVNHALLLSDIAAHDPYLAQVNQVVIDEAHHLEEEASRHFGWSINPEEFNRHLLQLVDDPVLSDSASRTERQSDDFWNAISACAPTGRPDEPVTITERMRSTPPWREAQKHAQTMDNNLLILHDQVTAQITRALRDGDAPREALLRPTATAIAEYRDTLQKLMEQHNPDAIQWIAPRQERHPTVQAVPLRVGPILAEKLFNVRSSVVLTSATLASGERGFDLLVEQVGFTRGQTIALPSPFDYPDQARLMSPEDLPNPRDFQSHSAAIADSLANVCRELQGHTLALFTSNAAIRDAARRLRPDLSSDNIQVLAQNIDGTASEIVQTFRQNPRSIILGTSSFWEGVDLSPDVLHAVAICKLPFPVPTEPVMAARSQLYQNPFHDYQVPLAILRFRQGFGRLVRNNRSRGSVIILDPRIRHKAYGREFVHALPPCDYAKSNIANVGALARQWIDAGPDRQTPEQASGASS